MTAWLRYPLVVGRLARPGLIAQALAPPAGAFVYINEKYLDPIPQGAAEQPQVAKNDQPAGAGPAPMPGDTGATPPQPPVENTGATPAPGAEQVAGGATTQPSTTGEQVAGAPTTQPNTLTADAQFDALETEFTELQLRRDPNCPVCSDAAVQARREGRPLTVGNVGADAPFLMTTTGLAGSVSPEARA